MTKESSLNFIYNNILLSGFILFQSLLSLLNKNIKNFTIARKDGFKKIIEFNKTLKKKDIVIWFHSASLGEYEQSKPIINKIRESNFPGKIIISFFSSSGYNYACETDGLFDLKIYLPLDTKSNAETIIKYLKPDLVLFLGYDVWPNLIDAFDKKNIPAYLINGTIRKNSFRYKSFAKYFFYYTYNKLKKIYTVSEIMKNRYMKICDSSKIEVAGDSRFDNVIQRKNKIKQTDLKNIFLNKFIFVVGSPHKEDDNVIIKSLAALFEAAKDLIVFYAPHKIDSETINSLKKRFETESLSFLNYTEFEQNRIYSGEKILLINTIGKLFDLYSVANITYIGGSFKQGIHNVMEPAVFGLAIFCGPLYNNSNEAIELKKLGSLFPVKNAAEFTDTFLKLYNEKEKLKLYKEKILNYVKTKTGTADYIYETIIKKELSLKLTSETK